MSVQQDNYSCSRDGDGYYMGPSGIDRCGLWPCAASTNPPTPPPANLRFAAFIDIHARPPAQSRPGFFRFRPCSLGLWQKSCLLD